MREWHRCRGVGGDVGGHVLTGEVELHPGVLIKSGGAIDQVTRRINISEVKLPRRPCGSRADTQVGLPNEHKQTKCSFS